MCVDPSLCRCPQDLLTDEPFTRKDLIHIQDPLNVSGRLISEFHHVRFVSASQQHAAGGAAGQQLVHSTEQ
jgi:peptidyl-prolyl cis-trans isomerase-like protein 2